MPNSVKLSDCDDLTRAGRLCYSLPIPTDNSTKEAQLGDKAPVHGFLIGVQIDPPKEGEVEVSADELVQLIINGLQADVRVVQADIEYLGEVEVLNEKTEVKES